MRHVQPSHQQLTYSRFPNATDDSLFVPSLLYLSLKGVSAPWAVGLAVFGQLWYAVFRVLTGHPHEGGPQFFPPTYVPGAVMRYAALPLLIAAVYGSL